MNSPISKALEGRVEIVNVMKSVQDMTEQQSYHGYIRQPNEGATDADERAVWLDSVVIVIIGSRGYCAPPAVVATRIVLVHEQMVLESMLGVHDGPNCEKDTK